MTLVVAGPGMSAGAVSQASTIDVDVKALRTRRLGLIQPHGEHQMHIKLEEKDELLELPQSLFSLVELRFGTVVRVRSALHDEHRTPADGLALAHEFAERLAQLGFESASEEISDAAVLKQLDAHDRAQASGWCGPWGSAALRAEVSIKRTVEAGTQLAEVMEMDHDGCVVSLVVWDDALDRMGAAP